MLPDQIRNHFIATTGVHVVDEKYTAGRLVRKAVVFSAGLCTITPPAARSRQGHYLCGEARGARRGNAVRFG